MGESTWAKWRRRILPRSLFGRFLLIIIVPNIIVQAVAVYMFYERHWQSVSRHMSSSLAGDIEFSVRLLDTVPAKDREDTIQLITSSLRMDAVLFPGKVLPSDAVLPLHSDFERLSLELNERLPYPYHLDYNDRGTAVLIDIQTPAGLLKIVTSRKRLVNPSTYIFIMWMTGTALLFLVIAVLFMRNQVRPIRRLSSAAEAFGKGIENDGYKPEGATEVRRAGQAFLDMKERINRQVEQRTEMLAGVSHDLKTPLTRIKLQLAMMGKTPSIKELQEDIDEMEKMVKGYLDFAKGKERRIASPVNIADLLRSITAGYRHQHHTIDLKVQAGTILSLNPNYFRRAVTNIIDNALRYAKNVSVQGQSSDTKFILIVDDDGPGIPPKKRNLVFKPFYRLDKARNMDEGGTGLGLTIAKDIITSYGGDISLDNSPLGGLRVVIRLPL